MQKGIGAALVALAAGIALFGSSPADPFAATQREWLSRIRALEPAKSKGAAQNKTKKSAKKKETDGAPPGNEEAVSFVKDVAPILVRNCLRCHGMNNPRSKFSLATYSALMKGGEKGEDDIVPGKPEDSRLLSLLKGEEEPRMPFQGRKLRDDLIGKIELWVKQGAKFDGAPSFAPDSALAEIVPSPEDELKMQIAAMPEPELVELHKTRAREHWQVSNPSQYPAMAETEHFIVAGSLPSSELAQAGVWAESAVKDLVRLFGRSSLEGIWRGKHTLHLFADRREYTEHALMIEGRELPPELLSHHYELIETSYAAIAKPPQGSPATLKGMVIEQVVASFLAAWGETPAWFNAGVGRYLAARGDTKAEIYRRYRQALRDLVVDSDPLAPLLDDQGAGDPELLGFGLVEFLASLKGEKGVVSLARELQQKNPPAKAIEYVYGADRKSLTSAWVQFTMKRYPAAKKR
jgi:hypothetical protein